MDQFLWIVSQILMVTVERILLTQRPVMICGMLRGHCFIQEHNLCTFLGTVSQTVQIQWLNQVLDQVLDQDMYQEVVQRMIQDGLM